MDLTDEQWALLEPLVPQQQRRRYTGGRGRPWRKACEVLNGVLWVLRTGAPWRELPKRYPPYQTCHRRFQGWVRDGTLRRVLAALAEELRQRGGFDLSECFVDGTFLFASRLAVRRGYWLRFGGTFLT
jgi:transposase